MPANQQIAVTALVLCMGCGGDSVVKKNDVPQAGSAASAASNVPVDQSKANAATILVMTAPPPAPPQAAAAVGGAPSVPPPPAAAVPVPGRGAAPPLRGDGRRVRL